MHSGKSQVIELILRDGIRHARISCPVDLIPSPGQYLLAGTASDSPLADPVFCVNSAPEDIIAAPVPDSWNPGMSFYLRGPLGRGFRLPASARRIALVAFDNSILRLLPLIRPALDQGAAVALVSELAVDALPDEVEIQPMSALDELIRWADWVAMGAPREALPGLRERMGEQDQPTALNDAEICVRTPVPCGGAADCGVCAVVTKSGWRLSCKDGPVFKWRDF